MQHPTWQFEAQRRRRLARVLLTTAALLAGGCADILKSAFLRTAPSTETVPAEFSRLPGKTVLVYVWVRPEIQWAYDKVRLDLANYLSEDLKRNVKGVAVVDYYQVESYLEKSTSSEIEPAALGRHFNADMVIHLSVYRLTLRDPGLSQFYRGRLGASVEVLDLTQRDQPPERIAMKDVEVTVPEEGPVGWTNVSPIEVRQRTYYAFTEQVGRKFHDYQRQID